MVMGRADHRRPGHAGSAPRAPARRPCAAERRRSDPHEQQLLVGLERLRLVEDRPPTLRGSLSLQIPRALSAEKGASMANDTPTADRITHILALIKQGDDAFNRRDKAAMDAAHHPEMVAHITGNAEPIHGRAAHAAAMDAMFRAFPDVHVDNDPYPLQFGQGDWMTVVTKATGAFSGEMALPDGTVIPGTASPLSSTSPPRRDGRATSSSRSTCSGTQRSWPSRSGSHSPQNTTVRSIHETRPQRGTRSAATPIATTTSSDATPVVARARHGSSLSAGFVPGPAPMPAILRSVVTHAAAASVSNAPASAVACRGDGMPSPNAQLGVAAPYSQPYRSWGKAHSVPRPSGVMSSTLQIGQMESTCRGSSPSSRGANMSSVAHA
jgi:hypothetical protein